MGFGSLLAQVFDDKAWAVQDQPRPFEPMHGYPHKQLIVAYGLLAVLVTAAVVAVVVYLYGLLRQRRCAGIKPTAPESVG